MCLCFFVQQHWFVLPLARLTASLVSVVTSLANSGDHSMLFPEVLRCLTLSFSLLSLPSFSAPTLPPTSGCLLSSPLGLRLEGSQGHLDLVHVVSCSSILSANIIPKKKVSHICLYILWYLAKLPGRWHWQQNEANIFGFGNPRLKYLRLLFFLWLLRKQLS